MLSNGVESRIGTLGSKYDFFNEWKRLQEMDSGSVELATMLKGICNNLDSQKIITWSGAQHLRCYIIATASS